MVTKKAAVKQKKIDSAVRKELMQHSLMFKALEADLMTCKSFSLRNLCL